MEYRRPLETGLYSRGGGGVGGNEKIMGDGIVELGAACTLALARDFYPDVETAPRFAYKSFDLADFNDIVTWPGCWRAAATLRWQDVVAQLREMVASASLPHPSLLQSAKRLIPSLRLDDFDDPGGRSEGRSGGGGGPESREASDAEDDDASRRVWNMGRTRTGLRAVAIDRAGNLAETSKKKVPLFIIFSTIFQRFIPRRFFV